MKLDPVVPSEYQAFDESLFELMESSLRFEQETGKAPNVCLIPVDGGRSAMSMCSNLVVAGMRVVLDSRVTKPMCLYLDERMWRDE